jgi:hypothetical protein
MYHTAPYLLCGIFVKATTANNSSHVACEISDMPEKVEIVPAVTSTKTRRRAIQFLADSETVWPIVQRF